MNAELRGLVDTWHVRGNELAEQYGRLPDGDPAIAILKMTVDTIDRCRSELEAALSVAQGQGWLPIESAPTTGLLLTFHPRFGQRIMRPDPHNIGWYLDETGGPTREVTHWQPLPAAPAQPDGVE